MNITICIGSSCHLKGSRLIVEELQSLVEKNDLKDRVELCGAFCMGNCMEGVCVKKNDEMFSLKPENTKAFFENEILKKL
ncbi:MAG: (2Fe-2S) ferredoxin domain-containing protein [Lachnotalea sp.]